VAPRSRQPDPAEWNGTHSSAVRENPLQFEIKRIHEPRSPSDGRRILIDRLWPRGLSKERAAVDYWAKDIAPSTELRKWYKHDPDKWPEFKRRYFAELATAPQGLAALRHELGPGANTILFASKEERLNNARALVEFLEAHPFS
jgi:uncharacterized protein YeaO (DUF488 family)